MQRDLWRLCAAAFVAFFGIVSANKSKQSSSISTSVTSTSSPGINATSTTEADEMQLEDIDQEVLKELQLEDEMDKLAARIGQCRQVCQRRCFSQGITTCRNICHNRCIVADEDNETSNATETTAASGWDNVTASQPSWNATLGVNTASTETEAVPRKPAKPQSSKFILIKESRPKRIRANRRKVQEVVLIVDAGDDGTEKRFDRDAENIFF
ncbi:uncharacterized protein LOC129582092 isoform X2 [Paramacrobiotus metropolitanus]|uniref:uncharacterized protein LOC129582092 isoform X2 n=1 Tax=Paramacrobiotus metropolitanus TaxID=2943436 RepID=UPI002445BCC2|nr:uncharacterized protein LOC129582092 isoform X2 [Paramacrobiotus metropolitanus]